MCTNNYLYPVKNIRNLNKRQMKTIRLPFKFFWILVFPDMGKSRIMFVLQALFYCLSWRAHDYHLRKRRKKPKKTIPASPSDHRIAIHPVCKTPSSLLPLYRWVSEANGTGRYFMFLRITDPGSILYELTRMHGRSNLVSNIGVQSIISVQFIRMDSE